MCLEKSGYRTIYEHSEMINFEDKGPVDLRWIQYIIQRLEVSYRTNGGVNG